MPSTKHRLLAECTALMTYNMAKCIAVFATQLQPKLVRSLSLLRSVTTFSCVVYMTLGET